MVTKRSWRTYKHQVIARCHCHVGREGTPDPCAAVISVRAQSAAGRGRPAGPHCAALPARGAVPRHHLRALLHAALQLRAAGELGVGGVALPAVPQERGVRRWGGMGGRRWPAGALGLKGAS